jgi:hypothetical protein
MMPDLRGPVLAAGVLGVVAIARITAWPLVPVELQGAVDARPGGSRSEASRAVATPDAIGAIVSRDPFRIGRLPAITAYDPIRLAQPSAPPPPRPALILVGVVDGAEASAVIEGFPGVEGARVVRVGDALAGLQVKQIRGSRVTIVGMDTTWVLEVREPWKN